MMLTTFGSFEMTILALIGTFFGMKRGQGIEPCEAVYDPKTSPAFVRRQQKT